MDTDDKLKEQTDRSNDFMVLATRRAGGTMAPILFTPDEPSATGAAAGLRATGWHRAEVWKLI